MHKNGVPFRSIVNGINSPTIKLAEVVKHELNDFVVNLPSYIRYTSDFICKPQKIQEPLPKDAILFCFDACKLYPSVPRKEGLEACEEALKSRSNPIILTIYVLEMIETV